MQCTSLIPLPHLQCEELNVPASTNSFTCSTTRLDNVIKMSNCYVDVGKLTLISSNKSVDVH